MATPPYAKTDSLFPSSLEKPAHAITTADLFVQCEAMHKLIDQFMRAMGKQSSPHPRLIVENAQLSDLLFQSVSIYNKSTRLAFEYTRKTYPSITNETQATVDSIWDILHQTLQILFKLQPVLDVKQEISVEPPKNDVTLSDISSLLIELNQRIDDMGWVQASPSETYAVLIKAIYVAAALLAESPAPEVVPEPPSFERYKTVDQVYMRLLGVMNTLNQISEKQHIASIKIRVENLHPGIVNPSDVNDMVYFILARLETFYALINLQPQEMGAYYHGWKFPSHIYQQAGLLEMQVQHLLSMVVKYPRWLRETATDANSH